MKLLMIAGGTIHLNTGYRHRVFKMAAGLAGQGRIVTLLWFSTCPSFWKEIRTTFSVNGFDVIVFPALPFFKSPRIGRLSRFICGNIVRIFSCLGGYEVIQAEGTLCGAWYKAIPRKKVIIDYHGDAYSEKKMISSEPWKHALAWQDEMNAINRADGAIVVADQMQDVLKRLAPTRSFPVVKAPCGVDVDRFASNINKRMSVRKELGAEGRFILCYMGGLQKWQCVDKTIEIVARLRTKRPDAFFLLLTQTDAASLAKGLQNIGRPLLDYSVMSLSSEEIPAVLPAADLGFLLREDNPVNLVASPTKFGEYLAAGVPVVATVYAGDAVKIIRSNDVGLLLTNVNPIESEINSIVGFMDDVRSQRLHWSDKCISTAKCSQSWAFSLQALKNLYRNFDQ